MTHFWLEDTRRSTAHGYDNANRAGNFLGSLWGLDAQQHYLPSVFAEYRVVSSFGAGVGYDEARARTLDWGVDAEGHPTTVGDGDVEIRGLQFYVFARYANRTRVTPYAQLGHGHYWSRFFVSPQWAAPGRRFEVDGTGGWFVAAGGRATLSGHLGLDALCRHTHTEPVTARAFFVRNRHRTGAFPMRSDLFGVGVVIAF